MLMAQDDSPRAIPRPLRRASLILAAMCVLSVPVGFFTAGDTVSLIAVEAMLITGAIGMFLLYRSTTDRH